MLEGEREMFEKSWAMTRAETGCLAGAGPASGRVVRLQGRQREGRSV